MKTQSRYHHKDPNGNEIKVRIYAETAHKAIYEAQFKDFSAEDLLSKVEEKIGKLTFTGSDQEWGGVSYDFLVETYVGKDFAILEGDYEKNSENCFYYENAYWVSEKEELIPGDEEMGDPDGRWHVLARPATAAEAEVRITERAVEAAELEAFQASRSKPYLDSFDDRGN